MVVEANYGGRVTDPKDRRLINIILKDFYCNTILNNDNRFSQSGVYYAPKEGSLECIRNISGFYQETICLKFLECMIMQRFQE